MTELTWRRKYRKPGALFGGKPVDTCLGHLELSKPVGFPLCLNIPTWSHDSEVTAQSVLPTVNSNTLATVSKGGRLNNVRYCENTKVNRWYFPLTARLRSFSSSEFFIVSPQRGRGRHITSSLSCLSPLVSSRLTRLPVTTLWPIRGRQGK